MSSDLSVKVAVRVRPLVESEKNRGCQNIARKTPNQPQVVVNSGSKKNELFTYNYVFTPEDTQETVYENSIKTMVTKLFKGYNVTILAYGQTGSGKTHTMGTAFDGTIDDDVGVIPRAVSDIFEQTQQMADNEFNITCSFVELYQEKLYDLLSPDAREQSVVDLREVDGKIVIPNLTDISVKTPLEMTNCLIRGSSDRAVASTAMNSQSSRSHAIFTITLQKVPKENPSAATIAKFHLVDLAGSERSKKTLTNGEQFKEGVKINQGLLALGKVISALGTEKPNPNQHIPYRESKLTRLLQDSLGGNSMTLMIACISPADYNMEETLGTLRYADGAKKIKNKPVVNEDPKTAEINRLKNELQTLRLDLLSKTAIGGTITVGGVCNACTEPPTKQQLQKQLHVMAEKMQLSLYEVANREHIITEYEETVDTLNRQINDFKEKMVKLDEANTENMSPDELKMYHENVHELANTICNITEMVDAKKGCILESSKASESQLFTSARSHLSAEGDFAECDEKYIKSQTNYQDELREMNKNLDVKSILLDKMRSNHQQLCKQTEDDESILAKMNEYEASIAQLEKEREELKEVLRTKNGSVSIKLAEERRKRVQQLETEIAEIRKKNKQQAMLLKQREKDADQIKKLNTEITDMRQMKVKLIRKMKTESDDFRQWRLQREKEVAQLRAKDQKMKSEAVKKDILHAKQRIVLQRKCEESNAANKRLKDALLRIQKTKESRQKNGKDLHRSTSWLNEELEVVSSVVDIKQSFEQLTEMRADLTAKLNKAKRHRPVDASLVKQLEEDIEMHNAQITDLRGKISENDLDAKIKSIADSAQTIVESRSTIKHLINSYIEQRNGFNTYFAQVRDLKHTIEAIEEQNNEEIQTLKKKLQEEHDVRMELEHGYEEKTALLLQAMSNEGSQSEIIAIYRGKIDEKNKEIEMLRSKVPAVRRPQPKQITQIREVVELDTSTDSIPDDDTLDPDWHKTPDARPKRRTTVSLRTISNTSNDSQEDQKSNQSRKPTKRSRSQKGSCGCKTGCKAGFCGCRKHSIGCSDNCHCRGDCGNVFNESTNVSASNETHDNETANIVANKENVADDEIVPCTPKRPCIDNHGVVPYVYSVKKRNPVFGSDKD